MVLLGHALGDVVRELQEPVVELAEVAEDERLSACTCPYLLRRWRSPPPTPWARLLSLRAQLHAALVFMKKADLTTTVQT